MQKPASVPVISKSSYHKKLKIPQAVEIAELDSDSNLCKSTPQSDINAPDWQLEKFGVKNDDDDHQEYDLNNNLVRKNVKNLINPVPIGIAGVELQQEKLSTVERPQITYPDSSKNSNQLISYHDSYENSPRLLKKSFFISDTIWSLIVFLPVFSYF